VRPFLSLEHGDFGGNDASCERLDALNPNVIDQSFVPYHHAVMQDCFLA
jgi:hypothetical protein